MYVCVCACVYAYVYVNVHIYGMPVWLCVCLMMYILTDSHLFLHLCPNCLHAHMHVCIFDGCNDYNSYRSYNALFACMVIYVCVCLCCYVSFWWLIHRHVWVVYMLVHMLCPRK